MRGFAAAISRLAALFPLRRGCAAFGIMVLAAGSGPPLSAGALPPVETDPEVIAAALAACDADDFDKCYVYGRAMLARTRTPAESIRAYDALDKACDGLVVLACHGAGFRYAFETESYDLARARALELRGCDAGDERACDMIVRLDRPPPRVAEVLAMPWPPEVLSYLRWLIYVVPDGAQQMYAVSEVEWFNESEAQALRAAACAMEKSADTCSQP